MIRSVLRFIALSAVLTVVSADVYPPCAAACIQAAVMGSTKGSCSVSDSRCLCSNTAYVANVTTCIDCTCSSSDATAAKDTSRQICHVVGVDLTSTAGPTPTCPPGASITFAQSPTPTTTKKSGALQTGVHVLAGAAAVVAAGLAL